MYDGRLARTDPADGHVLAADQVDQARARPLQRRVRRVLRLARQLALEPQLAGLLVGVPPRPALPVQQAGAGQRDVLEVAAVDQRGVRLAFDPLPAAVDGREILETLAGHQRGAGRQVQMDVAAQEQGPAQKRPGGTCTVPPPAAAQASMALWMALVAIALPSPTAPKRLTSNRPGRRGRYLAAAPARRPRPFRPRTPGGRNRNLCVRRGPLPIPRQ